MSGKPVGRIRFMDRQRVNLDGFAVENPELGLTALRSPNDPEPSLAVTDGRVTELDGVPEAEFDSIDAPRPCRCTAPSRCSPMATTRPGPRPFSPPRTPPAA